MNRNIDYITKLVMYKGPKLNEVIGEAIKNKYNYKIEKVEGGTQLIVESTLTYNVHIVDKYNYALDGSLIKQSIIIKGKEKIIFDKYLEIINIADCRKNNRVA